MRPTTISTRWGDNRLSCARGCRCVAASLWTLTSVTDPTQPLDSANVLTFQRLSSTGGVQPTCSTTQTGTPATTVERVQPTCSKATQTPPTWSKATQTGTSATTLRIRRVSSFQATIEPPNVDMEEWDYDKMTRVRWFRPTKVPDALATALSASSDGCRIPTVHRSEYLRINHEYWNMVREYFSMHVGTELQELFSGERRRKKIVMLFGRPSWRYLQECPLNADRCSPFLNWLWMRIDKNRDVVVVQPLAAPLTEAWKKGTPMKEVGSVANAVFNLLENSRPSVCGKIKAPSQNRPQQKWLESFITHVCDEVVVLDHFERGDLPLLEAAVFAKKKVVFLRMGNRTGRMLNVDPALALLYAKSTEKDIDKSVTGKEVTHAVVATAVADATTELQKLPDNYESNEDYKDAPRIIGRWRAKGWLPYLSIKDLSIEKWPCPVPDPNLELRCNLHRVQLKNARLERRRKKKQ